MIRPTVTFLRRQLYSRNTQCIEYRRAPRCRSCMQRAAASVARVHADGLLASWICIRHAFRPSLRKMSYFPEFCSQQPLKIFQKFLNRIVAQTSNLYAIIFDSVKNAQFLSEMRYSDPTHRKMGTFSHIFARPPTRGRNLWNFVGEL